MGHGLGQSQSPNKNPLSKVKLRKPAAYLIFQPIPLLIFYRLPLEGKLSAKQTDEVRNGEYASIFDPFKMAGVSRYQ